MQHEGLLGVAGDGRHQRALVAAPRHPQVHPAPAQPGQPGAQGLGVVGEHRDQDLAGHRLAPAVAHLVAVDLLEEVLDQVAGGDVLDLVDHPATLAAHPPAADVEDLDCGLERVLGERDDIGVGAVSQHDRLLLDGALEGLDVVAEPGGPLVVLVGGRDLHLLLQPAQVGTRLPGHEVAEVVDDRAVSRGVDAADARGGALADVAEQARTADLTGALEDPAGAGACREDPQQQVERLADRPGVRVGTEVADALLLRAAHHLKPRELLVQRHGEAGIALVVAVADVEPRVELLDPVVLQLEGLDLGGDDGPLDGRGRRDHRLGARVQVGQVLEVGRQARTQAAGLADVDDAAVLVAEAVDARRVGDRPRRRSVGRRISHAQSLRR